MTALFRAIGNFLRQLRWWVIVEPWELVLRVRLGRRMRVFAPGLHWRLPFADAIYRQSVRWRVMCLGRQTVGTRDGKTLTAGAVLGYRIGDLARLYNTLHHAEGTVINITMAEICACVSRRLAADLDPREVAAEVASALDLGRYGLADAEVRFTDFALVRAYRLVTDQPPTYTYGDSLTTNLSEQAIAEASK